MPAGPARDATSARRETRGAGLPGGRRTAVVLGGSMAGLLSAAALSPHVDQVVVVERDALPEGPSPRPGTPQATHAHGLLASGRLGAESVLPGFTARLTAQGAIQGGDLGTDVHWFIGGHRLADCHVGATGVAASRLLIEATVREMVRDLERVQVRDRTDVLGLVRGSGSEVAGVRVRDLASGEESELAADLVVDATGRPGRASRWFAEHGWLVPREERVELGVRYACTHVEMRDGDAGGRVVVVSGATPEVPRGGVALQQEDGRWVVMLSGYLEQQPPLDPEGFRRYAASVVAPELGALVGGRELLEAPRSYRFPHCVRRRVEDADLPRGYVAVGDAVCSIDPTFGQGMSLAALGAVALGEVVGSTGDLGSIGPVFHRRVAEVVDRAWLLVVGADVQIEGVVGAAPPGQALVAPWVRRVQRAATHDPVLARRLVRVTNLLDRPQSLVGPGTGLRLLRDAVRRPRAGVAAAG